jgi:hypothetical protein
MSAEQIVVAVMAAMWIVATVRGIRRLDAAEQYRQRSEALRRVVER